MEKKRKKSIIILVMVVILLFIDQVTKIYAISQWKETTLEVLSNILTFQYAENTGGAFGVGQNGTMTFIIANIVVLGIIIRFIMLQMDRIDRKTMVILSLVLAGGFSNLIDRIFRGFVVDFIHLFPNTNFPIFNLADAFIVIGWVSLALMFAIRTWKEKRSKEVIKKEKNDDNKVE